MPSSILPSDEGLRTITDHDKSDSTLSHNVNVSFVRSLLRAGVQPTLDLSTETFMSVQCASPGRRRKIGRCVRCMCELCRVEEGLSRREQLVRYF